MKGTYKEIKRAFASELGDNVTMIQCNEERKPNVIYRVDSERIV